MEQITLALPAIDETVIANINNLSSIAAETEIEALAAIRTQYSRLARQSGNIRIAHWSINQTNWSASNNLHYERGGRKIKALLALDDFGEVKSDQNSGGYCGTRLYLLESGEWLRIERAGTWSQWQGAPDEWGCGVSAHDSEYERECDREYARQGGAGSVRVMIDAEVEAEYWLADIVEELGQSLKTLAEKLPERMVRLQARVTLASQLLGALKCQN